MVTYNRPQPQQRQPNEHTIIKQEKIAQLGVEALASRAWLPQIFTMFPGARFKGALNDTLTWTTGRYTTAREYEWRTRLTPVQVDRIGTTSATVRLNKHLTQAVAVTNEQLTLDITDYATEVFAPQIRAMIQEIYHQILIGLRAADFKYDDQDADNSSDPIDVALDAALRLDRAGVPNSNRFWLVGANAEEWLLRSDVLLDTGRDGNTELWRNNSLGTIRGFNVVRGSSLIRDDEMYFGHKSGLLVANIAPEVPTGVTDGGRANANGFGLLSTLSYSDTWQATTSTLSTFMGVNSVNDELELDENGLPVFDENGDPVVTGKNVRIIKGTHSGA